MAMIPFPNITLFCSSVIHFIWKLHSLVYGQPVLDQTKKKSNVHPLSLVRSFFLPGSHAFLCHPLHFCNVLLPLQQYFLPLSLPVQLLLSNDPVDKELDVNRNLDQDHCLANRGHGRVAQDLVRHERVEHDPEEKEQ